jgi:hypothetical protein
VIITGSGNRKGDERHKKLRDACKEFINNRPRKRNRGSIMKLKRLEV